MQRVVISLLLIFTIFAENMIEFAELPKAFWIDAIITAIYLNHDLLVPSERRLLEEICSSEVIKVFSCKCIVVFLMYSLILIIVANFTRRRRRLLSLVMEKAVWLSILR